MEWYIIAFISAILSALAAVSQKKMLFNMGALDFSLVLSLFNVLFALFLIPSIQFNEISTLSLTILYCKTIFSAVAFWFVMLAIKNLEISGALPLMILTPALVALSAFIILGESITLVEIAGMGLLLLGIYVLETSNSSNIFDSFKIFKASRYKHFLIGAILLFTISSVIDKFLLKSHQLEPLSFLLFQQIFLAVNFILIYILAGHNPIKLIKNVETQQYYWIILIALFTIGYRYSLLEAMKIAPVALVLSIKRTSIFFATIIGGKIFSEHALLHRSIATLLMLG
ncbi:MAG: EamA family transporter [Chlorobi bacterium]|nr:EamA family transporter [Chlorobiota bacterium]